MNNRFLWGGILILLAVATLVVLAMLLDLAPKIREFLFPTPVTVVKGFVGKSKEGLLSDSAIQGILREQYHLAVDFKIDAAVCGLPPGDFLWPGTEVAVEEYNLCHPGKKATAESVLTSPLVFYSWAEVTDALVKRNIVKQREGVYYIPDMHQFFGLLEQGTATWKDFGLPQLNGKVAVIPADPHSADSGHLFMAMMANTLLGDVANEKSVVPILPKVQNYITRQGFPQKSTGALFQRFNATGMGDNPMIVAYESLLPDFIHRKELQCDQLKDKRVIYPEPTVWASHPIIAESDNGKKLMEALRDDPAIQKLAWERHGFRTWQLQIEPSDVMCLKLPAKILSTWHLPNFATMQMLLGF